MSEYASFLKVGVCGLLLRMLEEPNIIFRDMTLENPIRAIRQISHDLTCRQKVKLTNGREMSALEMQKEFLEKAHRFSEMRELNDEEKEIMKMWEHCLDRLEHDPLSLSAECDWVAKYHLVEKYRTRNNFSLADSRVALLDLQYHDVNRHRSLFYRMNRKGLTKNILDEEEITHAVDEPPATTRAKLRGEFIRRAKEKKRDYTVDWVHLKLNDQAQRTVLCKDPFRFEDERVQKLIDSL
jgi:proteasome accessory factor A